MSKQLARRFGEWVRRQQGRCGETEVIELIYFFWVSSENQKKNLSCWF
jgi:hypothetical protein